MIKVNFCTGLRKMGYKIQTLCSKNSFNLKFYEGTCFIKSGDIELIGDRILCLVTYFKEDSPELQKEIFTNCHEYIDVDINDIDRIMLQDNLTFFKNIVHALYTKIKFTNKNALIDFISDNFKMELNINKTLSAKIITDKENLNILNYNEILDFLNRVKSISKFQTVTITNKGCKKTCIIENSISETLKELYNFMNKTLILDYKLEDNQLTRCYLCEHHILELRPYSYGHCKICRYPLSKLSEDYPISISFTFNNLRTIQDRIVKDYNERNMTVYIERG